jgi:hypothetical protein
VRLVGPQSIRARGGVKRARAAGWGPEIERLDDGVLNEASRVVGSAFATRPRPNAGRIWARHPSSGEKCGAPRRRRAHSSAPALGASRSQRASSGSVTNSSMSPSPLSSRAQTLWRAGSCSIRLPGRSCHRGDSEAVRGWSETARAHDCPRERLGGELGLRHALPHWAGPLTAAAAGKWDQACRAEGRGFESHHPLPGKARSRGAFRFQARRTGKPGAPRGSQVLVRSVVVIDVV